jgi:hypothetical protein
VRTVNDNPIGERQGSDNHLVFPGWPMMNEF